MGITKPLTKKGTPSGVAAGVEVHSTDDEGAMIVLSEEEEEASVQDLTQDEEVEAEVEARTTTTQGESPTQDRLPTNQTEDQTEGGTTMATDADTTTAAHDTPEYPYTVQDVAEQCSVPVSRVNALRKAGHISESSYSKDGRAFVYSDTAVEEVRAAQEAKVKLGSSTAKKGRAAKSSTSSSANVGAAATSVTSALDSAIQAAQGEAEMNREQEALHRAEAERYEALAEQLRGRRDELGG